MQLVGAEAALGAETLSCPARVIGSGAPALAAPMPVEVVQFCVWPATALACAGLAPAIAAARMPIASAGPVRVVTMRVKVLSPYRGTSAGCANRVFGWSRRCCPTSRVRLVPTTRADRPVRGTAPACSVRTSGSAAADAGDYGPC